MVKDYSDSERGNPLPPLLFPVSRKGSFICTIPQTGSTYHGLCYTSHGALAGTRNSSMGSSWRINPTNNRIITNSLRFIVLLTCPLIIIKKQTTTSKVKFVLFNDATGTHWFLSYHRLLDVIHMVTLTHLLEGNPLPPHRLLFSISSKESFICTFP